MLKHIRFLKAVYYYQEVQKHRLVKESSLEAYLKWDYKTLHQSASYWQKKGCLESYTERGGVSDYALTSLGLMQLSYYQQRGRVLLWGIVGILLLIIGGAFFL